MNRSPSAAVSGLCSWRFPARASLPDFSAGVLLARPAIVHTGGVDCTREIYGCIGPAFFSLRTTVVALVLMALLRIRHPENLKEHPPVGGGCQRT